MTVAAILSAKKVSVISLTPGNLLSEACVLLAEHKIGAILILSDEKLEGILSERDIVRALSEKSETALEMSCASYMTASVECCTREEPVASVMARMTSGRFRHMPVLEGKSVVGVISIGDVVKHRIMQAEQEAADMRAYITG
ncbi:MAG: CBS domain-containing protein [Cohaesibacteraceae bacterium]|nr:CBS domain-containing protein [Cohaesibacteraceae bacterium]MBL4876230.1 CBS domain-containing protein [Cohaesibacteraceae bacterium]